MGFHTIRTNNVTPTPESVVVVLLTFPLVSFVLIKIGLSYLTSELCGGADADIPNYFSLTCQVYPGRDGTGEGREGERDWR